MEFILTSKGKPSLVYNGYRYTKKRDNKCGTSVFQCEHREKCGVTFLVRDKTVVREPSEHKCIPDDVYIAVQIAVDKAKTRAREDFNCSIPEIYAEEIEPLLLKGNEFVARVPSFQSIDSTLYGIRNKAQGNRNEPGHSDIVLSENLVNMTDGTSLLADIKEPQNVKKLSLKWKNIKDNYARSVRKRTKSAGAGRQYIYAKQLSFLQESMALDEVRSSEESYSLGSPASQQEGELPAELVALEWGEEPATPGPSSGGCRAGSRHKEDLETTLLKLVSAARVVKQPDADRSFFESLIPIIKNFNEDQKLNFRSEVLDLVRKIKRQNTTWTP